MAVSLTYNNINYLLPEGVVLESQLGKWLFYKDLSGIDRGDEMLKAPSADKANDHKLGKMELFQAITEEYQTTYQEAIKIAIQSENPKSKKWEEKARHLNELAGMIRELGYEPALHIDYLREEFRDYHFRLAHLIREIPPKERRDFSYFLRLHEKALPSCKEGGLGLKYPSDASQALSTLKQEEVIRACVQSNSSQWGACTNSALKSAMVAFAALAVYSGTPLEFLWFSMSNTPLDLGNEDRNSGVHVGHAFIGLKSQESKILTIDPSEISFNYRDQFPKAYSHTSNIWRAFLSSYYEGPCRNDPKGKTTDGGDHACHKMYELYPTSIFALNNLGVFLDSQGKSSQAVPLLSKAHDVEPENRSILRNLIIACSNNHQLDRAKELFQKLFQLENYSASVFCDYGSFLARNKDYDGAIAQFENALRFDSTMSKAHCSLGAAHATKREYEKARLALQVCVQAEPENFVAWNLLGDNLLLQGKYIEAEAAYKKVLDSSKSSEAEKADAKRWLGDIEKEKRPFWKKFLSFDWWPFW